MYYLEINCLSKITDIVFKNTFPLKFTDLETFGMSWAYIVHLLISF